MVRRRRATSTRRSPTRRTPRPSTPRFRAACAAHNPTYYERFKKWADEYFFIPTAASRAGSAGSSTTTWNAPTRPEWDRNFALTRDVGEAFLDVFPKIVRRRMGQEWTAEEKQAQLEWRGRYVEFNLVYDRGTLFGLKTGGNIDAILMSLPPEVKWS